MKNPYAEDPRLSLSQYRWRGAEPDLDTAERADIDRQKAGIAPRFWYMDAWQPCVQCRTQFLFSIREQRFWYEERRFHVDSYPVRCRRCRAVQRRSKRARQRYGELRAQAVRRDAPEALKLEVLAAIDAWEAGGDTLPDRAEMVRAILRRQIQRRRDAAAADSP